MTKKYRKKKNKQTNKLKKCKDSPGFKFDL